MRAAEQLSAAVLESGSLGSIVNANMLIEYSQITRWSNATMTLPGK
jgi:hypothetical protein